MTCWKSPVNVRRAPEHPRAFVNGWQPGRDIADLGPQHTFVIPNGILNPNGANTIAIAVWNLDTTGGLGTVTLQLLGDHRPALSVCPPSPARRTAHPAMARHPHHHLEMTHALGEEMS